MTSTLSLTKAARQMLMWSSATAMPSAETTRAWCWRDSVPGCAPRAVLTARPLLLPVSGLSAARALARVPLTDAEVMHELAGQPFARASVWRQMNGFTRLCMAATRLAVEDAGLPLTREHRDGIGLILGSMSGAAEVRSSLRLKGRNVDGARRIHEFTQVTLNTPAGTVCQALAIRGITTTITSGGASGTLALEAALDAIRLGRAEAMVVVAAEEACAEVEGVYRFLDTLDPAGGLRPYDPGQPGTSCGTAAVALVVEAARSAQHRQATVRGRLAGVAHVSDNYHPYRFDPGGRRYAAAVRLAMDRAALAGADIQVVAGSATGTDLDACEDAALEAVFAVGTPIAAMKMITGECESASGLINVAAPLFLKDTGDVGIPAFYLGNLGGPASRISKPVQRALATSVSFGSTYGAVVLERKCS